MSKRERERVCERERERGIEAARERVCGCTTDCTVLTERRESESVRECESVRGRDRGMMPRWSPVAPNNSAHIRQSGPESDTFKTVRIYIRQSGLTRHI